jgi:hypothetical protein
VTRELAAQSTRDGVVNLVVREGRAAFAANGGVVALVADGALSVVAAEGYDPANRRAMSRIGLDSRLPLAVATRTSTPVWLTTSTTPRPTTSWVRPSSRGRPTVPRAPCR